MNTQSSTSFQTVVDTLLDTKKEFPRRYLQEFSDLGTLELKVLLEVWPRVGLNRKLALFDGLEALAEEDTLVSFDDFARALLDDPEPQVRVRALRLLNESQDTKLIPPLLNMLKNDADALVRAEAASTLGLFVALGELEEIPGEAYSEVQAGLLESARGTDEAPIKRRALEALGFSSHDEVVKLIESALNKRDTEWQISALTAIGRSADERWEEEVLRGLTDEDDRIRVAAVEAAGNLALKSARTILLRILDDEDDEEVLGATIWSLSQIGGEDVRTYLENLLDISEDEEQTAFLEEALDNLAFTEDLDRFELLAFNPDELGELDEDDDEEDADEDDEEE
jgi:HEAT repeat protein